MTIQRFVTTLRSGHRPVLSAIAILATAGTMTLATGIQLTGAQESASTPTSADVTKETLGTEMSAVAPDRTLLLARRTFAPGADSGAHPAPGPVVLYVESGAVTFEVDEGAALVTRSGSTTTETVMAGNEVTLAVGDEVSYDQGVVHDVYNEGTVPAVTLEARLNPTDSVATPTPVS